MGKRGSGVDQINVDRILGAGADAVHCADLKARDNVNINTEGIVYLDICMDQETEDASVRAENIFFNMVDESIVNMGGMLKAFSGNLHLTDELESHTERSRKYGETVVSHARTLKLPSPLETDAYSVHVIGKWRRDSQGSLIVADGDEVELQPEVKLGYQNRGGRCKYWKPSI